MQRLIFLGWFLFLYITAFAQEKITDFENASTTSVNKTVYADTIYNKLLFFSNMPETAINLWVSDGTKEGTKMLKDSLGQSPQTNYHKTIKKYGYVYFGGIWKTDGEKIYPLPIGRDSLLGFQLFANKLLVYFQYSKQTPSQVNVNVSSFGWLDSLNQVKIWENDIISYQIIDNTLHYIKHNSLTQNYELHKISADNTHRINIISNPEAEPLRFTYFSKNNYDYYFFYTYQGWKFYHKPSDEQQNAKLEQWTSNATYDVRSFRVKDTQNNDYLLKFFNGIHIYKITDDNQLVEQGSLPPNGFMPDKDFHFYDTNIIENISISGSDLIYTTAYLSEGVSEFKLNKLNLDTYQHKRSKNLLDYSQFYYSDTFTISRLDTNTYFIDNNYGKKLTYNFLDSTISLKSYPYIGPLERDTLITLNRQQLLLSDNIYNITDRKTPLIPTREIFFPYDGTGFIYKALPDKLFFWKYNEKLQKTQLWVNNGNEISRLLLDLEGAFDNYYTQSIIEQNGRVYFLSKKYDTNQHIIYESDGTKEGTRKIDEVDRGGYFRVNKKQVIYVLPYKGLIIIEDAKIYRINNIPKTRDGFDVYVSDTQTYLLINGLSAQGWSYYEFFRVENDKVIYVDNDIGNLLFYKDKVFYTKRNPANGNNIHALYELTTTGKTNEIVKGINEAYVYGNKILYQQYNGNEKPPKVTILDIATNKVDITIDDFYVMNIRVIGSNFLLRSDSKSILVKGSKRKEIKQITRNTEISPIGNGFIIKNYINPDSNLESIFSLDYLDITDEKITSIVSASNGLNYSIGSEFILLSRKINNVALWSYWTTKNKKVIEIGSEENFIEVGANCAFSSNQKTGIFYWYFDGNYLTKMYKVNYNDNRFKISNDLYMPNYLPETGIELARLGAENLITYPEIVKGPEGIDIKSVFGFKNQIYLYGFTFTYGWQVWKMGKENPYPILSAEPMQENELIVYPNPVRDFLTIKTDRVFNYRVINIKGQELMQGKLARGEPMDLKNTPTGVYIIQFFDGNKVYSKKIIRN